MKIIMITIEATTKTRITISIEALGITTNTVTEALIEIKVAKIGATWAVIKIIETLVATKVVT